MFVKNIIVVVLELFILQAIVVVDAKPYAENTRNSEELVIDEQKILDFLDSIAAEIEAELEAYFPAERTKDEKKVREDKRVVTTAIPIPKTAILKVKSETEKNDGKKKCNTEDLMEYLDCVYEDLVGYFS
ncbi:hypothetical protein TKK_0005244 [Trichogramma kaykai]|uniref:Uncharacterized protein n=1 Tax=Trichogramma kaykai TaxID=54128 RepID=A0ABD2XH82_9HYME